MKKVEIILEQLIERYPILKCNRQDIYNAYNMLVDCFSKGNKLLIAGNGGSAADAEHIVGELMKGFLKRRSLNDIECAKMTAVDNEMGSVLANNLQGALPALALSTNIGLNTAFLNDVDGLLVFAQGVYGYGNPGDIFLGISTSGNSANVNYAAIAAKAKGMKCIALTGKGGGALKDRVDVAIVVDLVETYKIQELHLPIYHALCQMLEEFFF